MQAFNDAHSVTMINFYAPWCPWSQRLQPVFDAAAIQLHEMFNTNSQNMHSIALGRVNAWSTSSCVGNITFKGILL